MTQYWLCQFDVETWQAFVDSGAAAVRFGEAREPTVARIQPGDWIVGYLRGASRLIGALEVLRRMELDKSSENWQSEMFPIQVPVRPHVLLSISTAVPIVNLRDKLSIFQGLVRPQAWTGPFRRALFRLRPDDGNVIVNVLAETARAPIERPVHPAKLVRRPIALPSRVGPVTVPEDNRAEIGQHAAIQALLCELGSAMGFETWIAQNDRGREYRGQRLADLPGVRETLPLSLDPVLTRFVGFIDCCWISGRSVVAAFEIELTTGVFSGALRLADIIAVAPNIALNAYIVAPEARREVVERNVNRPTFAVLKPRLVDVARFIPVERLRQQIERAGPLVRFLRPEFLHEISDSCEVSVADPERLEAL
jgi:hypothetical protein